MRSFPADTPLTGDYITPHELNNELAEAVGAIHSLDLYNFGAGALTVAKLSVGAAGALLVSGTTIAQNAVVNADSTIADIFPVPDGAGDPWVETFTSDDGILRISCGGSVADNTFTFCFAWVGVRVDGQIVLRAATGTGGGVESWHVEGDVPVGAGDHLVEVVWGTGVLGAFGATVTYQFAWRQLVIREIAR